MRRSCSMEMKREREKKKKKNPSMLQPEPRVFVMMRSLLVGSARSTALIRRSQWEVGLDDSLTNKHGFFFCRHRLKTFLLFFFGLSSPVKSINNKVTKRTRGP